MKSIKIISFLLLITASFLCSCGKEELDPKSIFGTEEQAMNDLDKWLFDNYTTPYNIMFKYRFDDKESDSKYNLVPAEYNRSIALAKLVKYLWVESYDELKGKDFLRKYSPRMFHLIGSPAYNTSGSVVLGTAEGGLKITLYNVNMIDVENPDINMLNNWYFKTMHHEFAHILHQTKSYTTDFNLITPSSYQSGSWVNISAEEALKLGFVSPYASSETQEDFVEIIAIYVTNSEAYWQQLLAAAGDEGATKIREKFAIVKDYLNTSWEIDIDELRKIVMRRSGNVINLDLKTLN